MFEMFYDKGMIFKNYFMRQLVGQPKYKKINISFGSKTKVIEKFFAWILNRITKLI